jgi:hypothetical protein
MNKLVVFWFVFGACGSSDNGGSDPQPDAAPITPSGQHVVKCAGTVRTGGPSNCPHDNCEERGGDRVPCSAYASWVPGDANGLCNAGATGSYALVWAVDVSNPTDNFYSVIECHNGTPTQHICTTGYHTDLHGYDGQPGYTCIQ